MNIRREVQAVILLCRLLRCLGLDLGLRLGWVIIVVMVVMVMVIRWEPSDGYNALLNSIERNLKIVGFAITHINQFVRMPTPSVRASPRCLGAERHPRAETPGSLKMST